MAILACWNARIFKAFPSPGFCAEKSKTKYGHIVQQPDSIIAELEDAVRSGSSQRRVDTLRQVTNLFLHDGNRLSEDHVKVFDDVLCLLICLLYTSPSPRDGLLSRMPSSA